MTALTQTFTATSNAAIYDQGVQPLFAKVLIWRRQTGLRFEGHPEEPRQPPTWSLHAGLEGQSKRLRVSAGKQVLADGTTGRD